MYSWTTLTGVATVALLSLEYLRQKRKGPLPPGPPGLPLLGNVFNIPLFRSWQGFAEYSRVYGDITSFSIMGQPVVILSSHKVASELLEKRSSNYSGRPHLVMLHDLMGMEWALPVMDYGERWRNTKRMFHTYYGGASTKRYQDEVLEQSRRLLQDLHDSPEEFCRHTRYYPARLIMKITYGIDVKDENDEYAKTAEDAVGGFATASQVGKYPVELFPILKYLPSWFPGAKSKKDAAYWKHLIDNMAVKPFNVVKSAMAAGTAPHSIAREMILSLADAPNRTEGEIIARDAAGVAYAGATDTNSATLQSFILAMLLHPAVQRKAQDELDQVVGRGRLPNFNDREHLPYIEAIMRETLRWMPAAPMGAAHAASEDDVYNGYFIPKGTIVSPNAWAILRDPEYYPDPDAFNPDRFLTAAGTINPDIPDPSLACFGYGRRLCPGRFFAYDVLFAAISRTLHAFDITPALDEFGKPIPVQAEQMSILISFPEPFQCTIKPRPDVSEALIS